MNNYIDALRKRYASKRMSGEKIAPEKIKNILEAIHLSASSYGLQPYQVFIIQNEKIKKDLQSLCNNQAQIIECDVILLFAVFNEITEVYANNYIQKASKLRGLPIEKLEAYKNIFMQKAQTFKAENTFYHWAAKQTYLALGTSLMACALENIDSCPLEGFDKNAVDNYFNFAEKKLQTTVMLAIGKRDVENDFNATLPKYRKAENDLFIWKK